MARTFNITDGTTTVNLINTANPGIIASRGGFGVNRLNPDAMFSSSPLVDGAHLRFKTYPPVTERFLLNLKDSTHDLAAGQLQELMILLRKADQYQTTSWQQTPVYITQQTTGETNPRYALVIAWMSYKLSDFFDHPFEIDAELDEMEVMITREPFWRSTPPGTLPSLEAISHADFPYFDLLTESGSGNFKASGNGALTGDWGGEFVSAAAADTAYGQINGISNLAEFSTVFNIKQDSLAMTSGDEFSLFYANGSGSGGIAFEIEYQDSAGTRQVRLRVYLDSGASSDSSWYDVADGKIEIKAEWKASTGPGSNDGEGKIYVGGVLKETLSTLDNDGHDVDNFQIGLIAGVDAGTLGSLYIDDITYDDASPFVTAIRTIDFEQTIAFVANLRQANGQLTHIFNEDNSLAAFSSNLLNDPSFSYFVVSGSTPAVDDAIYFGSDDPAFQIVLNITTGGNAVVTLTPEFGTGAGWSTSDDIAFDNSLLVNGFTGHCMLSMDGHADFAKRTVNGQNKFWLRIRISAFTSWTTTPVQGNQRVYSVINPSFDISSKQILGDVPALALLRFINYEVTQNTIEWISIGGKSRGTENFISRLNPGGSNPSTVDAPSYDADTSAVANTFAPGGNRTDTTFTADASMADRITFSINDNDTKRDFQGSYNVYLRCRQSGGSDGDVSVRLKIESTVTYVTETVPLRDTALTEIVGLGIVSIGDFRLLGDDSDFLTTLDFTIQASAKSSTPDLICYDLIFIPSDEVSVVVSSSGRTGMNLVDMQQLQIDAGILRESTVILNTVGNSGTLDIFSTKSPFGYWETRGSLPVLEPRRDMRFYFLMGNLSGTILKSGTGPAGGIQLYAHERWFNLRGSDG